MPRKDCCTRRWPNARQGPEHALSHARTHTRTHTYAKNRDHTTTQPQHTTIQHSTIQHSMIQHTTIQHSTIQHTTIQHSTIQHTTIQHSTIQHTTIQHSTIQHTTIQHSTATRSCPSPTSSRCAAAGSHPSLLPGSQGSVPPRPDRRTDVSNCHTAGALSARLHVLLLRPTSWQLGCWVVGMHSLGSRFIPSIHASVSQADGCRYQDPPQHRTVCTRSGARRAGGSVAGTAALELLPLPELQIPSAYLIVIT